MDKVSNYYNGDKLDRNSADIYIEQQRREGFFPVYARLIVQVKCTYAHSIGKDNTIHYPLPLKNYNDLSGEYIEPRILVVVLVPPPNATDPRIVPWIECREEDTIFRYRAYWLSLMEAKPTTNQNKVTVKIPADNPFDIETVRLLMDQIAQGNKKL